MALSQSANSGTLAQQISDMASECTTKQTVPWPPGSVQFRVAQYDGTKRALIFDGGITGGDGKKLDAAIIANRPIDEIWFNSNGGNAAEGPLIGSVIRAHRLAVRVPNGYICISSCTIAFLGGVIRRVDPEGLYGVHTFYNKSLLDTLRLYENADYSKYLNESERFATPKSNPKLYANARLKIQTLRDDAMRTYLHEREQANALLAADWALYMQKMGVGRDLLTKVVLKQKSINYASDAEVEFEMKRFKSLIYDNVLRQVGNKIAADQYMLAHQQEINSEILKVLKEKYRDYICPSVDDLKRFNVVNVR